MLQNGVKEIETAPYVTFGLVRIPMQETKSTTVVSLGLIVFPRVNICWLMSDIKSVAVEKKILNV